VPRDLTIRPLGRPKISEDNALGFKRLSRKFVVEGPRVCKIEIEKAVNPLFLAVGTPDEEFTDHLLVTQQIEPAPSTLDKAYLTREYVQIRSTFSSESTSESGDFKRINRKYTVLRSQHAQGYGAAAWGNHPHNNVGGQSNDPWDYLPNVVLATEPVAVSYTDNGGGTAIFGRSVNVPGNLAMPMINNVSLSDSLTGAAGADNLSVSWVRSTAQVDTSNPGVDVWSVGWVAPVLDHWTAGNGKGGSKSFQNPAMIHFDENGLRKYAFGVNGAQGPTVMYSYISYVVGDDPGTTLSSWYGTGSVQPTTTMDFYLAHIDGNNRTSTFKHQFANAFYVQDTTDGIEFPDKNGDDVKVADEIPYQIIFDYEYATEDAVEGSFDSTGGRAAGAYAALPKSSKQAAMAAYKGFTEMPMFQKQKIIKAAGVISFSHTYVRLGGGGGSAPMGNSIKPIFSHGSKKIWKIVLTYVG